MKTISVHYHLILASALALSIAGRSDAVWITNFTSVSAGTNGSASGVWRNVTTDNTGAGVDSAFVVSLSTTGEVKDTSHPSQPSRIAEEFYWRDVDIPPGGLTLPDGTIIPNPTPFTVPLDLPFSVGANGDFINVETDGGASSVVTLNLGAQITNPMLSFSDIDVNTTLRFTSAFTVPSQTSNLDTSVAMEVSNDGTTASFPFDEEAAGSLQFSGVFTELQFTILNEGQELQDEDDRTGFVVSSLNEPTIIPEPSSLMLGALVGCLSLMLRRR